MIRPYRIVTDEGEFVFATFADVIEFYLCEVE